MKRAAQSPELQGDMGRGLVDIVTRYAHTFLLLQRYDEGLLTEPKAQAGGTLPTAAEARAAWAGLKTDLMARGEASQLFALEHDDALALLVAESAPANKETLVRLVMNMLAGEAGSPDLAVSITTDSID